MEPFIRSDQYNFIKAQTQILINGHSTTNDMDVLHALKDIAKEKVLDLFMDMSDEKKQFIDPILNIKDKTNAEEFLSQLKPYVIPFKEVTEQTIRKLFPKAKKLKIPSLENIDLKEISYLCWDDKGSNKKYIVAQHHNKLIGLQGTFTSINQKGICALCNRFEEIGMFISEAKGSVQGTFIKRGNHICQDSQKCNQNLITLDKLNDFIVWLNS
ncbi:FusB/FusC family EF-G-binding protein [Ectobacillus panaciterrae]|uniref:FusB/FusC family EF-G-binding protein n=1 Tax=Ectobacillus panaciterrae TaxID=363872 RepID=UPI000408A060|nr:elongation factor G-binding protein [Ectobacillus panaciterrae]